MPHLKFVAAAMLLAILFRYEMGTPLVVFNFHAWPVSGPGEGKVDFAGGEIRFRIRPWKIVTLRLAPAIEGNAP